MEIRQKKEPEKKSYYKMSFSDFKKSAESLLIDILHEHETIMVYTVNGNIFEIKEWEL